MGARAPVSLDAPVAWWCAVPGLFLLAAVVLALHILKVRELRPFDSDEGVYWQTVLALNDGHPLYGSIFYSQLPLFAQAARVVHNVLGLGVVGVRLGTMAMSAVLLVALHGLVRRDHGPVGARGAVMAALVSFSCFAMGHVFRGELSALALVVVSLYLAHGRRGYYRLAASALAFAVALHVKLVVAPAIVPLLLLVYRQEPRHDGLARTVVVLAGAGVCFVGGLVLVGYDIRNASMLQAGGVQAFTRSAGLRAFAEHVPENLRLLLANTVHGRTGVGNVLLPPLATLYLVRRPVEGEVDLAMRVWAVTFAGALLVYYPVHTGHIVMLAVPYAYFVSRTVLSRSRGAAWRVAGAIALLVDSALTLHDGLRRHPYHAGLAVEDLRLRPKTHYVLSDEPFALAVAGLRMPPEFIDVSHTRIAIDDQLCTSLDAALARANMQGVLVSGTKFDALPCRDGFLARARTRFPERRTYAQGKVELLLRPVEASWTSP